MISIEGGMANYGYAAFYGSLTETGKISALCQELGWDSSESRPIPLFGAFLRL